MQIRFFTLLFLFLLALFTSVFADTTFMGETITGKTTAGKTTENTISTNKEKNNLTSASKPDDGVSEEVASLNNRGLKYKKTGQFNLAMKDFNQAIRLDPEHAKTYVNRGTLFRKMGDIPNAISDYEKAIEINPQLAEAYSNRGFIYFVELNDEEKGCSDWRMACTFGRCGNINIARENGDCGQSGQVMEFN